MQHARPSLSVFFPCYNEALNIPKLLSGCREFLSGYQGEVEVILVNDGSTDNTAQVIEEMACKYPFIRSVTHKENKGYGGALISGFRAANNDLIFLMDADNQFTLEHLDKFIQHIEKGADVVVGYRHNRRDSFFRKLYAWLWGILNQFLFHFKVRDINCAYKLFRSEIVKAFHLESNGAIISTELMVKTFKITCKVVELPVNHYPRLTGKQTGANLKVIARAFFELIKLHGKLFT